MSLVWDGAGRAALQFGVIKLKYMNDCEKFSQIGGARLDFWNASWPFAKIIVTSDMLELKCLWKKYQFTKDQVVDLRAYSGIMSKGLLIVHKLKNYPHHIVFWTLNFRKLKKVMESYGFSVNDAKKSDAWYTGGPK